MYYIIAYQGTDEVTMYLVSVGYDSTYSYDIKQAMRFTDYKQAKSECMTNEVVLEVTNAELV